MPNPRTPSTQDFSTLETKERNDNTTLKNTAPEIPDRSNGNEFEVERRNEVHPDQSHGTELKEDEEREKTMDKQKTSNEDDDWDVTKQKKQK